MRSIILVLVLAGCSLPELPPYQGQVISGDDTGTSKTDVDGDGYDADVDCDDTDENINPDADEICDGIDNDCDGDVDDADDDVMNQDTWYADTDGDLYGDDAATTLACEAPEGFVNQGDDCDDTNGAINPSAIEVCNDIDDDCDELIDDEDPDVTGQSTFFADTDGDGYGDEESSMDACERPISYVTNDTDCDDTTARANPDEVEVCDEIDNDCDALVDGDDNDLVTASYTDADDDGFGDPSTEELVSTCEDIDGVSNGADCDDTDGNVFPGAIEVCDSVDNDCDGDVDDEDSSWDTTSGAIYYADTDGDGFGDIGDSLDACSPPEGYVSDHDDCDDGDEEVNPGADEDCDDSRDLDCSGGASDGSTDADEDGYVYQSCDDGTDCDDGDASINPGATDTWYDGVDSDCDGASEYDADGDGEDSDSYGGTDCDDGDATIYSSASETCDGIDNNCSGSEDDASDKSTWYEDADGDGDGGTSGSTTTACEEPPGYADTATDCDDTESTIYTGASELCDGQINDCSTSSLPSDETDDDGDGYVECTLDAGGWDGSSTPSGYEDCDDTDEFTYPGVASADSSTDCMTDVDLDGYGDDNPATGVTAGTDCNDDDAEMNPGATDDYEVYDWDCDGDPYNGALSVTVVDATNYIDEESATLTTSGGTASTGSWAIYSSSYYVIGDLLTVASWSATDFSGWYNNLGGVFGGTGTSECIEVPTSTVSGDDYVLSAMYRDTGTTYQVCAYYNAPSSSSSSSGLIGCEGAGSSSGDLVEFGTFTSPAGSDNVVFCFDAAGGVEVTHVGLWAY